MKIGDAVTAKARLTVYAAAGGAHSQGHQAAGARGVILAGPRIIGPTTWWRVNFTKAPDGWTKESALMPLIFIKPSGGTDWSLIDGRGSAPAATIQYPTLLNGVAARAPWYVAGVDYAVGYPTATVLTDWRSLSGSGIAVDVSGHTVTVSGSSPITFDSVDFSLGGGATIYGTAMTGVLTVTNSKFVTAGSAYPSVAMQISGAGSITFNYNVVDGRANGSVLAGMFTLGFGAAAATLTMKYNWVRMGTHDDIVNVIANGGGALTIDQRFNLHEGGTHDPSAHGDWLQTQGVGSVYTLITCNFNTVTTQADAGGSQGFELTSNNATLPHFLDADLSYNTFQCVAGSNVNNGVIGVSASELSGVATVRQNYVDITGIIGVGWYRDGDAGGAYGGTVTKTGNINMSTGAALT